MTGRGQALRRLAALQASWNYERMQGLGVAWASLPLLAPLAASDPERHRAAVARCTGFFNANPYLAGAAVGAGAREELAGAPGPSVERLRTALCGPLGALGDQLFWMGTVPALAAAALAAVALGAGWWAPVVAVALHAGFRFRVAAWALDVGLQHGAGVGARIQASWLPRSVEWAGRGAAVAVGFAVPLAAGWLLAGAVPQRRWLAVALALVFYRLARRLAGRLTAVELTLMALALTFLWHWSTA